MILKNLFSLFKLTLKFSLNNSTLPTKRALKKYNELLSAQTSTSTILKKIVNKRKKKANKKRVLLPAPKRIEQKTKPTKIIKLIVRGKKGSKYPALFNITKTSIIMLNMNNPN
ncbi:hypothetical protein KW795_00405 [Candidatus Microgenomates bacterium]|nr:hypothetical protein [Candidatus Microgenomates bacterium]